jgi:drug/metabolite transporter (DMT)-like permease
LFGIHGLGGCVVHDDHVSDSSPVPKQPMPTPTRVAVILLGLLAVLLITYAGLIWLTQEAQIDASVDAGTDRDTAAQVVLLYLIAFLVMGVCSLLAALFLPRRRAWARQVGVLVTSLLVVMSLFGAVSAGGISPVGLLVLVAAIAGLTSLMSRQTKDWVHGVVRTD